MTRSAALANVPHAADGRECWCRPRLVVICEPCRGLSPADPACSLCGGEGLVDAPARVDGRVPVIVIHNRPGDA